MARPRGGSTDMREGMATPVGRNDVRMVAFPPVRRFQGRGTNGGVFGGSSSHSSNDHVLRHTKNPAAEVVKLLSTIEKVLRR